MSLVSDKVDKWEMKRIFYERRKNLGINKASEEVFDILFYKFLIYHLT